MALKKRPPGISFLKNSRSPNPPYPQMKRRTGSVLPVVYSQVRQVATAAKPNPQPAWDKDSTVTPPAPNLSKWSVPAKPTRLPPRPPAPPPILSLNIPEGSPRSRDQSSPLGKWGRTGAPGSRHEGQTSSASSPFNSPNDRYILRRDPTPPAEPQWDEHTERYPSPNPLGTWSSAHIQRANAQLRPKPSPSGAQHDLYPQRGDPSLAGPSKTKPIGRWARQDALHQRQAPSQPATSNSVLQRDEAPHTAGVLQRPRYSREPERDRWGVAPTSSVSTGGSRPQDLNVKPQEKTVDNGIVAKGEAVEEPYDPYMNYIPEDGDPSSKFVRKSARDKSSYKTRGSISSGEVMAIPGYSRMGKVTKPAAGKERDKRPKTKALKRAKVDVFIPSTVSVGQLARLLNIRMEMLQRMMVNSGMAEESAYDHILTSEYAGLLAEEFNRNPVINDEAAFDIYPRPPHPDPSSLPLRPPVITIMGHVDHGKTTLLDTLRSASVAKGEAGGITQHIGAFSVPVPIPDSSGADTVKQQRTITFLDTPGHAAFSAMRARGAGITDIIVLVVAADDGVMPQTKEVIELTKKVEEKVGVVVAINKVDKHTANVDKVTHALMAEGIQLESFGGETPGVEVSGLTGHGLDGLVETLSAMAEMQDLHAERDGQVHGYVLESNVRKGLGLVATVLILRGCLTRSSHLIAGTADGKVRMMNDSTGAPVLEAYPGMAVTVSGWKELPNAGDEVLSGSEADVKKALANRQRKAEIEATLVDMEVINTQRMEDRRREDGVGQEGIEKVKSGPRELRLVIKGDVSGSVEALEGALQDIGNKDAVVKIVSTGVGDVSESDVMMAKAAQGMIVAFSVNIPRAAEGIAASNEVPLYPSKIIYQIMDEVRNRVTALLPPTIETKVTGELNVLELFDINLKGSRTKRVAGCRVINGLVEKSKNARVVRDGIIIHEGPLETLKQGKRDLTEIRKGMECGLSFVNFEDVRQDDLIQMYQEIEKPGVL